MRRRLTASSPWLAVALLTALAAGLRFSTLGARSFWADEGRTVLLVHRDLGSMLSNLPGGSELNPAYYVLAWLWSQVFGTGEAGLRSLSALIGTATVPVVHAIALRLATRRVAVIAGLLAAVSPMLVWQAQDARPYALLVFLTAVSFLCFISALRRPTRRALVGWVAFSLLAIATHYFAIFVVAVEAGWLLWQMRSARVAVFAAAGVAVAGAALIVLALVVGEGDNSVAVVQYSSLRSRLAHVGPEFVVGFQPPWQVASAAVASALVAVALWQLWTRGEPDERRAAHVPLLVGAGAIALPVIIAVGGLDYVYGRNLSASWVPLCIVAALGFGVRRPSRVGVMALTAICAISVWINVATADHSKFDHEDWRAAARALGPAPEARALVVTPVLGYRPLAVYRSAAHLRPVGALVNEIAVIGLPRRFRRLGETPRPPRPPSPVPPRGFVRVGRIDAKTFTLVRYRSRGLVHVDPVLLNRMALDTQGPTIMLESPGADPDLRVARADR
jgi:hypothetical protein